MITVLKALADPTRLRLVGILEHGEFTVQELVSILKMGQSRVSRHLKILAEAGICTVQRQGTWSYFRLNGKDDFFQSIRAAILERLPHAGSFRNDRAGVAEVLERRRIKSRQFFDRHARQWDRLANELIPVDRYAGEILAGIEPESVVVDVGVGTGRLLGKICARSRHVIGVDHSSPMLAEAGLRVERDGLTNVELRLGEMAHLPLADASVRGVILNMVLHHADSPLSVLGEMNRVLETGGKLVIADLEGHQLDWFRDKLADQWMGFAGEEIDRWLAATGFEKVRWREMEVDPETPRIFVLTAEKITTGTTT